ncbi:hypothetical protein GGX14DRAFT_467348 [Mycena pura]|uniref:Hydrophobin n=1 Tax=Mycena pura TaxID=153505 RepID=A0AAD6Y8S2_9AGAR|nr:hypothetical protein GGX14DRAFT_467348 [Mycena pura]
MFFKLPLLATAFLAVSYLAQVGVAATDLVHLPCRPLLLSAAPAASPPPPGTTNLCCSTVDTRANPVILKLASLLGVVLTDDFGNIGVGCTVLTVLKNTCSNGTAVNCHSSQLGGGLINVGCVPITL